MLFPPFYFLNFILKVYILIQVIHMHSQIGFQALLWKIAVSYSPSLHLPPCGATIFNSDYFGIYFHVSKKYV